MLTEAPHISVEEISAALGRLKPGKVMPSNRAPAALWKRFGKELAPLLQQQFAAFLCPGALAIPEAWSICELVLLPKPGKPMKTPAHLRPIALLPPQAKILATVLAERIQATAAECLQHLPQYAYVTGRTLGQALERVIGHCAEVRGLVQGNIKNIHQKRQGRTSLSLFGGIHLSLDLTGAYDHVQWHHLQLALQDACIPSATIQLIMLIHHSARLLVRHGGQEKVVQLRRGLRQGCSLFPTLWAIFSGWLLKQMHDLNSGCSPDEH